MKKIICSSQLLSLKKNFSAILISFIFVALPLSAISATTDDNATNDEIVISERYSDNKGKVSVNNEEVVEVSNKTIEDSKSEILDDKVVVVPTNIVTSSNTPTKLADNKSPTSAADAYLYKEKVENLPESEPKAADKSPSWMSLEYLLGGGLLLILLGGIFLMLSKINSLKSENRDLNFEKSKLKAEANKSSRDLKASKQESLQLNSEIRQLKNAFEEQKNSSINQQNDVIDLLPAGSVNTSEAITIEDLNQSDRNQLASIFDNWLKTNRGNTKVDDLIPEDINEKLKHLHYTIELWGQGNGLDSVESTKNSMHTAVISLIKNDSKGYAYCYKKPNSMSSLWDNKAWYAVEKANGTLKLTGEPLEAN